MHVPNFPRRFPAYYLIPVFFLLTLPRISCSILTSLLVYTTLPSILWEFFFLACGHPQLCNFLEPFSADIFHDPCLQSRMTYILCNSRGVSNEWVLELPNIPHSTWHLMQYAQAIKILQFKNRDICTVPESKFELLLHKLGWDAQLNPQCTIKIAAA